MGRFISKEEISKAKELLEVGEITEEELEELVLAGTPELWVERNLSDPDDSDKPISIREYQREVLVDAGSICLCWGRGIGKTISLCMRLAWEVFTESDLTILVYAPRVKHIRTIFDYFESMIKNSPNLTDYIVQRKDSHKKIKEPEDSIPRIEIANGSKILFFHTQNKIARELIRGTHGDKFFLEEAHYIDDGALAAIAGVITSSSNVFIWAQSTPRGKESWFYDFSHDCDLFSHHTSMESPDWNKNKERVARMLAPDEGSYRREYLAEFLSDGWSAFTEIAVDTCQVNAQYKNGEIRHQEKNYLSSEQVESIPGEIYIGVDWNIASSGTKIIIFKCPANNPKSLIYQGVKSIESPTYTQLTAIDKLFEIIEEHNVNGVAIDKGYASGQVEIISKKLEDPKYKWLKDKFHVVDFAEIINIPIDEFFTIPLTNEEYVIGMDGNEEFIKRPTKAFMVSIMTKIMLSGLLSISPLDKEIERKTLLSELRRVKIEKVSAAGYPVYTKSDLHKFAAALLAIYAFFLEHGEYFIVKENNKKVLRKEIEKGTTVGDFLITGFYQSYLNDQGKNLRNIVNPEHSSRNILQDTKNNVSNRLKMDEDLALEVKTKSKSFIDVSSGTTNPIGWRNIFTNRNKIKGSRSI